MSLPPARTGRWVVLAAVATLGTAGVVVAA